MLTEREPVRWGQVRWLPVTSEYHHWYGGRFIVRERCAGWAGWRWVVTERGGRARFHEGFILHHTGLRPPRALDQGAEEAEL